MEIVNAGDWVAGRVIVGQGVAGRGEGAAEGFGALLVADRRHGSQQHSL